MGHFVNLRFDYETIYVKGIYCVTQGSNIFMLVSDDQSSYFTHSVVYLCQLKTYIVAMTKHKMLDPLCTNGFFFLA